MKITLEKDQKIFFTSDTHFGHSNICRATTKWTSREDLTRDFSSLEDMNETLIKNINDNVGENDILFHLGDWSFGGIENIMKFRERIFCKNIHLILGNHDHHIEDNKIIPGYWEDENDLIHKGECSHKYKEIFNLYSQKIFKSVNNYLKIEIKIPQGKNVKHLRFDFVLCHYPIASWHDMNKGVMHLFGHVHLPKKDKIREGKSLDVGCDGNDLKPYSLEEVIKLIEKRPIKKLSLPADHHEARI